MEKAKIEKTAALLKATAAEADRLGLDVQCEFPGPAASGNGCRENIDHSLFVSATGGVSPCVFVNFPVVRADARRRVMGNVLEQDPQAIWESAEYRLFRDRLSAREIPICPAGPAPSAFTLNPDKQAGGLTRSRNFCFKCYVGETLSLRMSGVFLYTWQREAWINICKTRKEPIAYNSTGDHHGRARASCCFYTVAAYDR